MDCRSSAYSRTDCRPPESVSGLRRKEEREKNEIKVGSGSGFLKGIPEERIVWWAKPSVSFSSLSILIKQNLIKRSHSILNNPEVRDPNNNLEAKKRRSLCLDNAIKRFWMGCFWVHDSITLRFLNWRRRGSISIWFPPQFDLLERLWPDNQPLLTLK